MAVTGGYEYSFVDPPDELLCMVCHHVAKEAHQVECCGKIFCKTCITEVNGRMGICPNCRKASPKIFSDLRSVRDVKRLMVACENEEKGCGWSGAMESYETHKEECGFKEVQCPNLGCSETVLRRFLEEHLSSSCLRRQEKCMVCHNMIVYEYMPTHPNVCPKVEVECNNSGCSVRIFREQLTAHQCVCPKQIISCPYGKTGCNAQILREDRQKHLLENIEQHGKVASNTVLSLRKELNDVRKRLETAKQAFESKCTPPVTFKVPNYRQMKENNGCWNSPYFYTHPGGYKMSLEVEINSQDDNAKDHISLFFFLHPSCNDDSLFWPFAGKITVQLLNQCYDSGHFSKEISWGDTNKRSTSIGECNTGWGYGTYISHILWRYHIFPEKEFNHYLVNDCIYFRVLKICNVKPWLTSFACQ